jgi:bifunctional non-homologous end joining protein LigD
VFFAFELLHLNGQDLTSERLEDRKGRLEPIVRGSGFPFSQSLSGSADQVIEAVRRLGLEGVVTKRKDSRYNAGIRTARGELRLQTPTDAPIGPTVSTPACRKASPQVRAEIGCEK